MSIDFCFEADERLPEGALVSLLRETGAVGAELENGVNRFVFSSGMTAFPRGSEGAPRIKAEDPRGVNFRVCSRCTFYPVNTEYDTAMSELRYLLELVAARTGAFFIVSFQYEETLFIHAGAGVQQCV